MKVKKVEAYKIQIPVKGGYRMARGTHNALDSLLVRITTDDGATGVGEAHQGVAGYSSETVESMYALAKHTYGPALTGTDISSVEEVHARLDDIRKGNLFLKCAFETAVFDLIARQRGISVATMLGGPVRDHIMLSGGIGIEEPETIGKKLSQLVEQGYRTVKIKIGTDDLAKDIRCVKAARQAVGDDVAIRVDANSGYTTADAVVVARGIADCNIEHFEQPVGDQNLAGMARLRSLGAVPILADESVSTAHDVMRCIEAEAVDAVKIKITKVGGYVNARRIIELCQTADVRVVIGQGLCSTLEACAEVQIACAFTHIDPVGEMVGPAKLADDLVDTPADLSSGRLDLPSGNGIGADLSADKLSRYGSTEETADLSASGLSAKVA